MRVLFMATRLFIYGYFCDLCVNLCTHFAEKSIKSNRPLTKKLLTLGSNFSYYNLKKWQIMEINYIRLCISLGLSGLL